MLFLWRSDGYDRFCSLACEVSSSVNFIAPGVSSVLRTTPSRTGSTPGGPRVPPSRFGAPSRPRTKGTAVTELVYRHELRPVIESGASVMDSVFPLSVEDDDENSEDEEDNDNDAA